MKPIRFLLLAATLAAAGPALAATADGSGALALGTLVGQNSPLIAPGAKALLAKFLDGETKASAPAGQIITVQVDKLVCKASNVDITLHSCELVFGTRTAKLTGRQAHELYATLAEVGVPPDGGAGSSYEALTKLTCTIDPNVVKQMSGGGAHCDYGPPD
jgi:hypothetical protein